MDKQIENFWRIMKEEMATQTRDITEAVTRKVSENINEKLTALVEENNNLKMEVKILHDKSKLIEEHRKKNTIIFFGIKEEQRSGSPFELYYKTARKRHEYSHQLT